ncbi:MAG: GntR family transcriptional regulator, partial [Actinomycetota bacterium]|nr:GntR family transcriptional regulator [Actinomycetota bacterium]
MAQSPPPLDFALDRDSDVPLGTQLAWRLRALIATGRLAEGERLPGVREMAALAGVNVNTVRTVYTRLAEQGVIASEHGRGTFVGPRHRALDDLGRLAAEAAGTAREAGIDPRDLAAALYAAPAAGEAARASETGSQPPTGSHRVTGTLKRGQTPFSGEAERSSSGQAFAAEARRRAALRTEIAGLERELAKLELPQHGENGEHGERRPSRPTPHLLTAAELESIRDELVERLRPLRADRTVARDERQRVQLEPAE